MFYTYISSTMLLLQVIRSNQSSPELQHSYFQPQFQFNAYCDSIPHPDWENHSVYLFRPQDKEGKFPVIFFCHGITATHPSRYEALIKHMVNRGYAVIYSPYPTLSSYFFPSRTYRILWNGIVKGTAAWEEHLDLDNIGFVGHSYGAGAIPSLARKAILIKEWGEKRAFLYMMAPWYVHGITQHQLKRFPDHVKVIVEVFGDDNINDHRIGKDIVRSLGIAESSKLFCELTAYSEQTSSTPDHDVPIGASDFSLSVDDFDFCGVHFVFDAISTYSENSDVYNPFFHSNDSTFLVRSPSGNLCCIRTSKHPSMNKTQDICVNFWKHAMNPRRKFYKHISDPLRIVLGTPETVYNYGTLALSTLNEMLQ